MSFLMTDSKRSPICVQYFGISLLRCVGTFSRAFFDIIDSNRHYLTKWEDVYVGLMVFILLTLKLNKKNDMTRRNTRVFTGDETFAAV